MQLKERLQDRVFTLSIAIAVLCIILSIVHPTQFPTTENFSQILLNLSIDTIVAVGMMILMICRHV
jgi:ribose transport system permease protein